MVEAKLNRKPVLAHLPNSGRLKAAALKLGAASFFKSDTAPHVSRMDLLFIQLLREAVRKGVRILTQTLIFTHPHSVEVRANSPPFSLG